MSEVFHNLHGLVLISGRMIGVEHDPEATSMPASRLRIEVRQPYLHDLEVSVPWMPMVYPNSPGKDFAEQLADAGDVVIRAQADGEGNLTATRADIYVKAVHHIR